MKSKIISTFLCVVMIANISASIIQNIAPLSINASGEGGPAESSWGMFHQNPQLTGQSPHVGAQNPELKWTYPDLGKTLVGSPSPTIDVDGTVYVGGEGLFALYTDGTLKWRFNCTGVESTPAIDSSGVIYFGCSGDIPYEGIFYALYPNGTMKWDFYVGERIWASPIIGPDGTIYFGGTYTQNIYAMNPNGSVKWIFDAGENVLSSTALGLDGIIYFGGRYNLFALYPNGSLKWKYHTGSYFYSSPAIGSDGTIYIGCYDYYLHALNPDGSTKWTFLADGCISTTPAIDSNGTIYFGGDVGYGDVDGKVYALYPNGSLKWTYQTEGKVVNSSPAIGADGLIYIVGWGSFYALNQNGSLNWKYDITPDSSLGSHSNPSIASDGTTYVVGTIYEDGFILYAFSGGPQPPIADAGFDQTLMIGNVVQFNGSASYDPDGTIELFEWDFDASDGLWWETGAPPNAYGPEPTFTYYKYGIFIATLRVTDNNGSMDTDICEITMLVPTLPPILYINVSLDGYDVILYWDPPPIPGIKYYLIYRSTSQIHFDFDTIWKNTSSDKESDELNPIPLRTMWNDTNAAFPGNATNYSEQYYYTIRAVNILGEVSGTSRTVGKWTKTFPKGVSTFSLPLEPLNNITIENCLNNLNASYIKWMHLGSHKWMKPGEGREKDTQMKVGEGYEVKFSNQINYTFTGMPGAMISYDDDSGFLGFDYKTEAKNLTVTVEPNGDVNLTWPEPSSMSDGWYGVYYSNKRDGFFGTFNTNYFPVVPSVSFGNNTATHRNALANESGARLYYMVIPFSAHCVRGASTYSIGIWTEGYLAQYDTFGLPLKFETKETADWYCDNIPDTVGMNYYIYSEQRWCWHSTRMPKEAYDPLIEMTKGYQISTSNHTKFTFIGV